MKAKQAIDSLKPKEWANTSAKNKLDILYKLRENLGRYGKELSESDTDMKNGIISDDLYTLEESLVATVAPLASSVSASIELYEHLIHTSEMPEPVAATQIDSNTYDIQVYPNNRKEKIIAGKQTQHLRVKGKPKQVNPLAKPGGITAVLGAGNYSSSLEMIKALFFDNSAVVHKPHHLNEETDAVWEKIMEPLIEVGALTFCEANQGRELTADKRLTKIYFTGGTSTAEAIMSATDTPLISECGGNNPCIIVPGDRPWTEKELEHQAIEIATIGKLNGGAVCGRVQTIVTSKHWDQREAFIGHLKQALKSKTPAAGTYYPGSKEKWAEFKQAHPEGEVIKPEGGERKGSDFMLITGVSEDSFAVENEAFCQIFSEVPLDLPAKADEFLPGAVRFCNDKLLGTLGAAILIDEDTRKAHTEALATAVNEMQYGGIAVNTMPPFVFLSPYLTWGGNEDRKNFVSGIGNFGNAFNFENVEKSIIYDDFMSAGHMMNTNKKTMKQFSEHYAAYATNPSWGHLMSLLAGAVRGNFRSKDF